MWKPKNKVIPQNDVINFGTGTISDCITTFSEQFLGEYDIHTHLLIPYGMCLKKCVISV